MDSGRHSEKQRRRNRRIPADLRFDEIGLNAGNSRSRSGDLNSSSNFGARKYSPDAESKHWAVVSEGFPPGTTVDELKKYSRRRLPCHLVPQDNLHVEEGTVEPYKSEYKRRYRAYETSDLYNPAESGSKIKTDPLYEDLFFFLPEYKYSYVNYPRKRPILKRPPNNLKPLKNHPMDFTTEKSSQFVAHPNSEKRKLIRRLTALKPASGAMATETEVRKEFRVYLNPEKAQMIKRLPSLKVEGKFESWTTEQQDKYISYLLSRRPILEKKKTLLKMEGDFDFLTEKNFSYVHHEPPERPRIRKRSTSLKLDGELEFFPEYRNSFVDFQRTRPVTYKPDATLRANGDLESQTETKTQFVNFENVHVPESAKPENNLHMEGEMEIVPEYKVNYVDFPRERPFLRKPLNQLHSAANFQILSENSERFPELRRSDKSLDFSDPKNAKPDEPFEPTAEQNETDENLKKLEAPLSDFKAEENVVSQTNTPNEREPLVSNDDFAGRRPASSKFEREFLFDPEYARSNCRNRNARSLKPVQTFRSNPASPRKKPKDMIDADDDKKFILGTPRRRMKSKRPNENAPLHEKRLTFDLPREKSPKVKLDEKREIELLFPDKAKSRSRLKPEVRFPSPGAHSPLPGHKDFQAFHVLDVKGQLGCHSMTRNLLGGEKPSSDEEQTFTYRLEVSDPEKCDFLKNDWKVYPTSEVAAEIKEEAERRARRRAEAYEKVVKGPQVPNYLLQMDDNRGERNTKGFEKPSDCTPTDGSTKRAFVVLDGGRETEQKIKDSTKRDGDREASRWLSSSPIS